MWALNIRKKEKEQKKKRNAALLDSLSPLFSAAFHSARLSIEPQRAALTL